MVSLGSRTRIARRFVSVLALVFLFSVPFTFAEIAGAARRLELLPAPKEMQVHEGAFRVRAATRIVIELGHQSEDRIAAETLAEEDRG